MSVCLGRTQRVAGLWLWQGRMVVVAFARVVWCREWWQKQAHVYVVWCVHDGSVFLWEHFNGSDRTKTVEYREGGISRWECYTSDSQEEREMSLMVVSRPRNTLLERDTSLKRERSNYVTVSWRNILDYVRKYLFKETKISKGARKLTKKERTEQT